MPRAGQCLGRPSCIRGSTNHCIHLIAIARAAGYRMNWSDFDAISSVTPLIARVYPNGSADVNHFHARVVQAHSSLHC